MHVSIHTSTYMNPHSAHVPDCTWSSNSGIILTLTLCNCHMSSIHVWYVRVEERQDENRKDVSAGLTPAPRTDKIIDVVWLERR